MGTSASPASIVMSRIFDEGFATGDGAIVDELCSPDLVEHQFGLACVVLSTCPTNPHVPRAPHPNCVPMRASSHTRAPHPMPAHPSQCLGRASPMLRPGQLGRVRPALPAWSAWLIRSLFWTFSGGRRDFVFPVHLFRLVNFIFYQVYSIRFRQATFCIFKKLFNT